MKSGEITHIAIVDMKIQDHNEQIPRLITMLGHYPIVLGIRWVWLPNVVVRFESNTVTFGS